MGGGLEGMDIDRRALPSLPFLCNDCSIFQQPFCPLHLASRPCPFLSFLPIWISSPSPSSSPPLLPLLPPVACPTKRTSRRLQRRVKMEWAVCLPSPPLPPHTVHNPSCGEERRQERVKNHTEHPEGAVNGTDWTRRPFDNDDHHHHLHKRHTHTHIHALGRQACPSAAARVGHAAAEGHCPTQHMLPKWGALDCAHVAHHHHHHHHTHHRHANKPCSVAPPC